MELLAIGLTGCTAMNIISILKKKHQEVKDFEVHVHANNASDHPKVFTHLTIECPLTGKDLDYKAIERAMHLSETKYCSAQAMFKKVAPIDLKIVIK